MRAKFTILAAILTVLTLRLTATGKAADSSAKNGNEAPALALVILYDGSGSMLDNVPDVHGVPTPKFKLANNALITIAQKVEEYCTNKHVSIDAGLVYFTDGKVKVGIPFQSFKVKAYQDWAQKFHTPAGGTPLGEGIKEANRLLAGSKALKKHILIVTDGESNSGETPQAVLRRMQGQQNMTSVYFVAFDVAARVFNPVKQLGATVVSAANELQLKTQLDALLEKKILLEAE